ncbi:MAG: acetyl-CoA carboxylase biotin carboxyl carrier protein [Candidatus Binatia bacterium]
MAELTEDDVLQILNLIENSSFDFMQLQVGDLKLTVSKSGYLGSTDTPAPAVSVRPAAEVKEAETKGDQFKPMPRDAAVREGVVPIAAPMVGTFYTTPDPEAPPYVDVGAQVDEDTTVGLIEVMKVFTAVKSGVRGAIDEICVQNGQFIEYGQTLFLVSPNSANVKGPPG